MPKHACQTRTSQESRSNWVESYGFDCTLVPCWFRVVRIQNPLWFHVGSFQHIWVHNGLSWPTLTMLLPFWRHVGFNLGNHLASKIEHNNYDFREHVFDELFDGGRLHSYSTFSICFDMDFRPLPRPRLLPIEILGYA